MKAINLLFPGSFLGNCLFSYAWARGYAERHGLELRCGPWIGQKIFQLDDAPIRQDFPAIRSEYDLRPGESEVSLRSYAMSQLAIDTYTRTQARRWFTLRPEIAERLAELPVPVCAAHVRHGDFSGLSGYVLISEMSYLRAANKWDVQGPELIRQETAFARPHAGFSGSLAMLPDFYRLMMASILFRANSSFSWWAATLGNAERVFAPDLTGIPAGLVEPQDVPFVEGNWPALSNSHYFCTDLHLSP